MSGKGEPGSSSILAGISIYLFLIAIAAMIAMFYRILLNVKQAQQLLDIYYVNIPKDLSINALCWIILAGMSFMMYLVAVVCLVIGEVLRHDRCISRGEAASSAFVCLLITAYIIIKAIVF